MIKKFFALIGLLLCLSCEEEIVYTFETKSFTNDDFEGCEYERCPNFDIRIIKLTTPPNVAREVNGWIDGITIGALFDRTGQAYPESIVSALEFYINDSQISYPETSVLSDAHELQIDVILSYTSNRLLSVQFNSYRFSGGAHGFESEMFLNYDPKKGKIFEDYELFEDEFYDFATPYFQKKYPDIVFDLNGTDIQGANLFEVGFTQDGAILIYDALVLNEFTKVAIPWEEVEDYLSF